MTALKSENVWRSLDISTGPCRLEEEPFAAFERQALLSLLEPQGGSLVPLDWKDRNLVLRKIMSRLPDILLQAEVPYKVSFAFKIDVTWQEFCRSIYEFLPTVNETVRVGKSDLLCWIFSCHSQSINKNPGLIAI